MAAGKVAPASNVHDVSWCLGHEVHNPKPSRTLKDADSHNATGSIHVETAGGINEGREEANIVRCVRDAPQKAAAIMPAAPASRTIPPANPGKERASWLRARQQPRQKLHEKAGRSSKPMRPIMTNCDRAADSAIPTMDNSNR